MSKRKEKITKAQPAEFQYVEPVKSQFDLIQDRVVAAVHEMNDALKAAHECADMRVFLSTTGNGDQKPLLFVPLIYKLSYAEITMSVTMDDSGPKKAWQQVKDPSFKDVAGQGFRALKK